MKGSAPIPLSGALALLIGGVLVTALLLVLLATSVRASRGYSGGLPMSSTRRWRLLTGVGLLGAATVVGIIGWLKLSDEPLLNRQVPYFASTGIAVMILAIAGGALLVAEQMRTDDRRLDELEGAVRALAEAVGPAIERPARLKAPARETVAASTASPEVAGELSAVKAPAKKAAAKRAPAKKAAAGR